MTKKVIREKVENIAKTLHIADILERMTMNLSGGEKQRVALGRAIINEPDLLIMDEPYASMDKNMADELIIEEKKLQRETKQTTIHITHNHEEAATLADRICIMDNGKIKMIGTAEEVFQKPNSSFVANFLCAENVYSDAFYEKEENNSWIEYNNKQFYFNPNGNEQKSNIEFCIRSENIILSVDRPATDKNVFKGTLMGIYSKGEIFRCVVDIGFELIIKVSRREFLSMKVGMDDTVYASIPENAIHII